MSILFIETPDATQGQQWWNSVVGAVTYDTTAGRKVSGLASWKCDTGAGSSAAYLHASTVMPAAGGRVSAYYYLSGSPGGVIPMIMVITASPFYRLDVRVSADGYLTLMSGSTTLATGSAVSLPGLYRVALAASITSASNYTARVYLNGNLDINYSPGTSLTTAAAPTLNVGLMTSPSANYSINLQHVYVDDVTSLDDPGDVRVTAKLPNVNVTNQYTAAGTGAVNERPIDDVTDYCYYTAKLSYVQDYTVQPPPTGDVAIPGEGIFAGASGSTWGVVYGANWQAQSFTPSTSDQYKLRQAVFLLNKLGTPANALTVALRAAGGDGLPTGSDLTSATIAAADVGGGAEWLRVTFSPPYTLLRGNAYAFVFYTTGGDALNCYQMAVNTGNPYSGGLKSDSANSGSSWTAASTYDLSFSTAYVATSVQVVGRCAWMWYKGSDTKAQMYLVDDDTVTITATAVATPSLFANLTTTANYPAQAHGIGQMSTAAATDSYLYECGTLIAYKPTPTRTLASVSASLAAGASGPTKSRTLSAPTAALRATLRRTLATVQAALLLRRSRLLASVSASTTSLGQRALATVQAALRATLRRALLTVTAALWARLRRTLASVSASLSLQARRALLSLSASLTALGRRTLLSVQAALKYQGRRALASITAALRALQVRSLSAITAALKATPRRSLSALTAALRALQPRSLSGITVALWARPARLLSGVNAILAQAAGAQSRVLATVTAALLWRTGRALATLTAALRAVQARPLTSITAALRASQGRTLTNITAALRAIQARPLSNITVALWARTGRALTALTTALKATQSRLLTSVQASLAAAASLRGLTNVQAALRGTFGRALASPTAVLRAVLARDLSGVTAALWQRAGRTLVSLTVVLSTTTARALASVTVALRVTQARALASVQVVLGQTRLRALSSVQASVALVNARLLSAISAALLLSQRRAVAATAALWGRLPRTLTSVSATLGGGTSRLLNAVTVALGGVQRRALGAVSAILQSRFARTLASAASLGSRIGRPEGDISAGSWTTAPLWDKLDEE